MITITKKVKIMGKNNKKGGSVNPKPPQPSFFQMQKQRLGEGFMNMITIEDIRKNALKIFTDLAVGAINPESDYEYFNRYDFTANLLQVANDNLRYRQYIYTGLVNNIAYPGDTEMQRVATELYDQIVTYNSVVLHLSNILNNITLYNGIYTTFYLHELIANIRWKRNTFTSGVKLVILPEDNSRIRNKRREIPNDQGYSNQDEGGFFNKATQNNYGQYDNQMGQHK